MENFGYTYLIGIHITPNKACIILLLIMDIQ